jgi:two-component system NarL family response regulator
MPSKFGILRVLVVEDDPVIVNAINASVAMAAYMAVVGEAKTGADGVAKLRASRPDVLLVDIHVPRDGGLEVIERARAVSAEMHIIAFGAYRTEAMAARVINAGASEFMLTTALATDMQKVVDDLIGKTAPSRTTGQGPARKARGSGLSEREVEVLRSVAAGHTNREIARLMTISDETVKGHLKNISQKLGARHRTEAVAMAYRQGLIGL